MTIAHRPWVRPPKDRLYSFPNRRIRLGKIQIQVLRQ